MKHRSVKGAVAVLTLALALVARMTNTPRTEAQAPPPPTITISPVVPTDIQSPASLENAAAFAWQEFIALNWPAQRGARDNADTTKKFGDPAYTNAANPLVWHTFRGKIEIYPGFGNPNGYTPDGILAYGYNNPPKYIYSNTVFPQTNGLVPPAGAASLTTPWINLDENSEIGLNMMYAGIAPTTPPVGQQILFMAKANHVEYIYVAQKQWWANNRNQALQNTANYVQQNGRSLPAGTHTLPGSTQPGVSFPNGTIELKAAWRQLTPSEASSGRFYQTTVRHYVTTKTSVGIGYVDSVWGLVALHIIQKTPSSPYFIYATFSQADNLLDANGNPVEDVDGRLIRNQEATPFNPNITSRNATSANPANRNSIQMLSPSQSTLTSGKQLYYENVSKTPTPQGIINLNKRKHDIPDTIIQANQAAHAAIATYNQQNNISSPWPYYKLVNVQYQPYDKPAGVTYTGAAGGPDPSTYYQSNEVVESDYNLQVFSGQFQNTLCPPDSKVNITDLITDYNNNGTVFKNVAYNGSRYLMGGCMGCHGNAQVSGGADFSFIFKFGPTAQPDTSGNSPATAAAGLAKFRELFLRRSPAAKRVR